jgi:hypothetical protein
MDEDLRDIESQQFKSGYLQTLLSQVVKASELAAEERDKEFVDSPSLRKALTIIEDFLRIKKRICYGGMAINTHLPKSKKFYDFRKTLPDYDFFTPDPESDITYLLTMLKKAGFTEVSARLGIHAGTTKVFVNYTGVADITFMPEWMYRILLKRALIEDGIYYVDTDFLRMNMYLELSRPHGEVERWDKVYKRLLLLNLAKPIRMNSCENHSGKKATHVNSDLHEAMIEYLATNDLIFAGAELDRIYRKPTSTATKWLLRSTNPILTIVENPEFHTATVKQILHGMNSTLDLRTIHWSPLGEIIPEMYGISLKGRVIFLAVAERFCHAYNTVSLGNNIKLKIAALDTAITLFYSLTFVRGLEGFVPKSLRCFTEELINTSMKTRDQNNSGKFPLFPVTCQGHQPTKPSLLREKAARVVKEKEKAKAKAKAKAKTRKRYPRSSRKTRKNHTI